jgi:hypothetical protein
MRKLIPIDQVSPEQVDTVRESVEAQLISKANQSRSDVKAWRVRDLLSWTDLGIVSAGQGAATANFWGCGALAASTALIYVPNTVLASNEFVGIYGIAIRDVNPCVIEVIMQTGNGASTKARWNVEGLYASLQPIGVTPEWVYYAAQDTIQVTLMPNAVGKAVGADGVSDHVELMGLVCTPAGDVISM